jgi:hypothetical protein
MIQMMALETRNDFICTLQWHYNYINSGYKLGTIGRPSIGDIGPQKENTLILPL